MFDAMNQGASTVVKTKKWTFEMGLELMRALEPFIKTMGYTVTMTGSVLHKGESTNNLNLVFLPRGEASKIGVTQDITLLTWLGETLGKGTLLSIPSTKGCYRHYMQFKYDGMLINTFIS